LGRRIADIATTSRVIRIDKRQLLTTDEHGFKEDRGIEKKQQRFAAD
jgi:hypothetical protein